MRCGRGWRISGKKAARAAIAAMPMGRLIQKMTDQCRLVTMKAPSSGPMTAEKPQTLESQPWTRARSAGV